ncbi:expressed protein [Arabidopsis lyrata subsp. lyrata]|uniref:Expressed protein n=1 Tax=Arabidopsis lyrata subsp. lyrata TaxID=81972 RepID=D7MQ53_ARALL|nr:expressed protein [Arabidopsis lyrata subsp. lyrata]
MKQRTRERRPRNLRRQPSTDSSPTKHPPSHLPLNHWRKLAKIKTKKQDKDLRPSHSSGEKPGHRGGQIGKIEAWAAGC